MTEFPLFNRAERCGVFDAEKGWLISAPTATGKSRIAIEVIKRNLPKKPRMETFVYLVPFKALAEEAYSKLKEELPGTSINIKTGDYDRPFEPKETDVLVATYESMDAMIQQGVDFYPSIIIADEFSVISDDTRGARIESLISYLAKFRSEAKLYVLSAVIRNPERIGKWLDLNVLTGDEKDRCISLEIKCILFPKGRKGNVVKKLVKDGIQQGSMLIFCETKKDAENLCYELKDHVAKSLKNEEAERAKEFAAKMIHEFPYLVELPELLENGLAFHHADLEVDLRKRIEEAFRKRIIKVVTATTTLSAGVNLPARFVIVRDVTRYEYGRKLLSISEMINMLGRAGRPGYDKRGTGYFLIPKEKANEKTYRDFIRNVKKREIEEIESQIPKSIKNILQFILATVARFKGITRDELIAVYNDTLCGFENPIKSSLMLSDNLNIRIEKILKIPSNERVRIDERSVKVVGDTVYARGGSKNYMIKLSENESSCECPAYQYNNARPCKHIRQLQFEAILGVIGKKNPEAKRIALASLNSTILKQDPMHLLSTGVDLLIDWQFLTEDEEKIFITKDGRQALVNYLLEMDHIRLIRDRLRQRATARDEEEIIEWAICDYSVPKSSPDEFLKKSRKKALCRES